MHTCYTIQAGLDTYTVRKKNKILSEQTTYIATLSQDNPSW